MKGEGEKCSKFLFSLEKIRGKQKTIIRLKRADGSLTSESKIILEECRKFYQNLYDRNYNVDSSLHPEFFRNVTTPKLSDQQKKLCEANLTIDELFKCFITFRKNYETYSNERKEQVFASSSKFQIKRFR